MNSIDTSLCCHINDYVYIQLTYTRTLSIAHAFMYNHIYIRIYREVYPISFIVGGECVRGITHFALALPFCNCITHLHLHYHYLHLPYPLFALALPFCTWNYPFALALPVICTCITQYLHLHYPFALEITHLHLHYPLFALVLPNICTCITLLHLKLPICTCITRYLHLYYPIFALALPICTWITHLHLNYPFALALPICTCITHLWFFWITHYPSIAGINNTHNCIINCKALQHVILGMVLSSNNKWSQHRLLRARSARDWCLQVFTHFIHA